MTSFGVMTYQGNFGARSIGPGLWQSQKRCHAIFGHESAKMTPFTTFDKCVIKDYHFWLLTSPPCFL